MEQTLKKSEMDLTTGNLFFKIPLFVLPLMMTTIFQLLYTTIDLWTVSTFGGGALSMTAVGSNGHLINLIITVLVSLATGANVTISIAKGKNDKEKATRILHTSLIISTLGGIIFALFGFFMSPIFLNWMSTPASIIDKATSYLQIYFLGVPFLMIYNFGSQMLRALGDSRRPLYILIISGLVNVGFDLLFVIKFKMDVKGVAYATIISEGVSALLTILWLALNKKGFVKFSFKNLKFSKQEFIEILRVGIPAGLQGLAFSIPNVLIQSSLYTITDYSINGIAISQNEIISGASASGQIENYIFAMLDAFAIGLISFTGQNYGANKKINMRKCYWYSVIWMSIFWLICLLISLFAYKTLLSIFIKPTDELNIENAIAAGKEKLYLLAITYILDGIMDINSSYLRGMKISTPPAIITMLGCTGTRILFIFTLFTMPTFHTIFWLYAAFPISWIIVNVVYLFVVPYYEKKIFKNIDSNLQLIETQQ